MTLPVGTCPRCGRPIEPDLTTPDFDHPDGQMTVTTYGPERICIECEWDSTELHEANREVIA